MFDIYTNRIPFGLLTEEEQSQLKAHKGEFNVYCPNYSRLQPRVNYDSWMNAVVYRAVKEEPKDIQIPWGVIDKKWQWAARDDDGKVNLFQHKPYLGQRDYYWALGKGEIARADIFANLSAGNKPWWNSLIQRPEGV